MSDGCYDANESSKIGKLQEQMGDEIIGFFTEPSKETLAKVYGICDKLKGCRGYFGETGDIGKTIADYFHSRYDKGVPQFAHSSDVAFVLSKLKPEARLEILAELLHRMQGRQFPDRMSALKCLKHSLTIEAHDTLQQKDLDGTALENMLLHADVQRYFGFKWNNNPTYYCTLPS